MASIVPIISQCNQNCLFCSAKVREEKINLKNIYKIIEQEKDLIVVSGGEPTLSKSLFKIIEYVKNRNLKVELQTNAVTLSYFDLAERLINAKVDLFNVNLPSHREELSDKITQTKGFFKKRIEGIKNLLKLRANIRITHIINSLTYQNLPELIDYVNKQFKGITYIQFSFIKIIGSARKNTWINPKYEEVKNPLLKALRKCQEYRIDFLIDHIPICYLPNFEKYHIDFIKFKNGQQPIFSLKEKVKLKQCQKCKLEYYCCGARRDYIELFGGKISLNPIT